ncbi:MULTISPECIES: MurR/RpiR family transcriptional regulator [unclassified Roseovarius]|uniref:MurR/RpiR family transcriptional regulator n=1 Tax=unclassified Roseovarius TaxID=2614913 RepID=UPI00273FA875|nr:MurR/RpiR family transcriptional regulator [Roseovarius sp. MMSF_3350]
MENPTELIHDRLSDLSKKLTQVARFALDNPDRMAFDSMRAIASDCDVSPATMQRLAKALGYDGYAALRSAYQASISANTGFGARVGRLRNSFGGTSSSELIRELTQSVQCNLATAADLLDAEAIDAFAKSVHRSRYTYLLASGSLYWLSGLMEVTGSMALPNFVALHGGLVDLTERLAVIDESDSLLVFSVSPYSLQTIRAVEYAHSKGAQIFTVTDRPSSPLVPYADTVFYAPTTSPHYYPSLVSVLFMIETLLATAASVGDERSDGRLREIEKIRGNSGLYLD